MLINLSNHPIEKWSQQQLDSAKRTYKSVIDLPFPKISPSLSPANINFKAKKNSDKCEAILRGKNDQRNAVHIMGEMTFCYAVVTELLKKGIECVASASERDTLDFNNWKLTNFKFVRFRKYKS